MINRTRVRNLLATAAFLALTAGGVITTPAAAAPAESRSRFIITVADAYDSRQVAAEHRRNGAEIDYVYTAALNGFAGAMSDAELGALQRDRRVTRIERDGIARASAEQFDATWGLDRIDQRALPLSTTYTYASTGSGVNAYIIDTGIRTTHTDFGGRAVSGYDAVDGGTADDCNGHGTHVAGTVGGTAYGVAKAAKLVAVRVLDCGGSGTWSGVIAGIDWVKANHVKPAVANMSLGGGASASVDAAVDNAIAAGVTMVVAAGNGNQAGREQDACNYSPARVPAAVTIGATTSTDAKTSWSNYGSCVDLFAPGASITSAWIDSDTAIRTISGTSMAAPHVAGVAALYLQGTPGASPGTVRDAIYAASTKGIVTSSKTANNHLVYSPLTVDNGPVTDAPPSASFSFACTDLDCSFDGSSSSDDVSGYSWNFGDGTPLGSGPTTTHAYAAGGTYSVTLTVKDDAGQSDSETQTVTVAAAGDGGTDPETGITLTASGYKVKGVQYADLTWSGATSTSVDVYRDGAAITTGNDGAYTDNIGRKGGGSYTYKVCEAGTSTCSKAVTVTF